MHLDVPTKVVMDHISDIKRLIHLLTTSERMHLLIVHGPPGWAKTQSTSQALAELGVKYETVGSYSTALGLFNRFVQSSDKLIVADDTSGLLSSSLMVSILCSASWPSGEVPGKRRVRWTSTSERALAEFVDFSGKIIILTNVLPSTPQVQALVNRALLYKMEIAPETIGKRLCDAALSIDHFPNQRMALEVAQYLADDAQEFDLKKLSLRTLEQGYELACLDPSGWRALLPKLLPRDTHGPSQSTSESLVKALARSDKRVQEQVIQFCRKTGLSRRTFFNLRARLGLMAQGKDPEVVDAKDSSIPIAPSKGP